MKISKLLCIAALGGLAACQQGGGGATADAAKDPGAEPAATVNGQTISKNLLDFYVKAATGKAVSDLAPEQRQEALDALVRVHVVGEQAIKDKLDADKDIAAQLALVRLEVLQRAAQAKYLKDKTPTEAELRSEYETQVAQMPKTEYRARHILVPTEDGAKAAIAALGKGARFEDVAKRESIDGSKERGGDLGWFTPQTMVKPFADAVMGMKKGQTTAAPVQSQFGWHVIRLEDTRDVQPPPFDGVKDQLTQVVLAKKFKGYADELLKTAKVEKKL